MKARVVVNANTVHRLSFEQVVQQRQISRMLVDMLVGEFNYNGAAEIVAGFADGFRARRGRVEESISDALTRSTSVSSEDLKALLDTCRAEIAYMGKWSQGVLGGLPAVRDAAVLRAAFGDASAAGASLLEAIESATERFEEAGSNAGVPL